MPDQRRTLYPAYPCAIFCDHWHMDKDRHETCRMGVPGSAIWKKMPFPLTAHIREFICEHYKPRASDKMTRLSTATSRRLWHVLRLRTRQGGPKPRLFKCFNFGRKKAFFSEKTDVFRGKSAIKGRQ